jgi:hypothetical protein
MSWDTIGNLYEDEPAGVRSWDAPLATHKDSPAFASENTPTGMRMSPMSSERSVTGVSGPDKGVLVAADGFEPPTKGL